MHKKEVTYRVPFIGWLACIVTSMVGYQIHGSVFWATIDFFFAPLPWLKWLIFHEVSLSIIKKTFEWFLI